MKYTSLFCSVSAICLLSVQAHAQEAESAGSGSGAAQPVALGEIIVTANKREQDLSKVGASLAVMGAEQLAVRRVANVEDLAQATPGLVASPTQDATPVYTLRGIGFFENTLSAYPDVSVYLDQAPLSLPAMAALTVFDLERVEVLKGPQGTLFGNNATGGAINFIAAKPTDYFAAGLDMSYGRFNTVELAGFVSGPLTDTLRARLAGKVVKGDEWQYSHTRDDKLGKKDNVALRFILDWEPSDALKFSLNLNGWANRDDPIAPQTAAVIPQGQPVDANGNPVVIDVYTSPLAPHKPRAADWGGKRPFQDDKFKQATWRGDYELGGLTLTSITGYSDLDRFGAFENDGTQYYNGADSVRGLGLVKSFTQELRLANDSASRLRWVIGGNYERTTVHQETDEDFRDNTTPANSFLRIARIGQTSDSKMRNIAAFGNIEFDLTDQFTLKGGIRRTKAVRDYYISNNDRADFNGTQVEGPNPPGYPLQTIASLFSQFGNGVVPEFSSVILDTTTFVYGTFSDRLTEHNTSWSVGVDFKPSNDLLLYANVAKGYKAGSYPHLSGTLDIAYTPATQESLLDYEAGFKAKLLDRKLMINGAAFYYDYKDKQVKGKFVDPNFNTLNRIINVPKSVVKGAELEVQAYPVAGLSLSGSLLYLDAKVKEYFGALGSNPVQVPNPVTGVPEWVPILASFKGVPLPFAPKWQYSLRVDYDFPLNDALNGFVGAGMNGQSETIGILQYFTDPPSPTFGGRDIYAIKPYALFNANIGIRSSDDKWRVTFWGKNIFNKYYTNTTFQFYDTVARYVGRGADYGLAVAVKF